MNKSDLALKYMRGKIKRNRFLVKSDFTPGNMLFYSYNPKDDINPYDKTPLIIVIKANRKHILGINFHWAPINLRKKILQLLMRANKDNIKNQKPLEITNAFTANLYRLCKPIFRKYIKSRISRRGCVIPQDEMGYVINLKAETFIGISADDAYKLAILKLKNGKKKKV